MRKNHAEKINNIFLSFYPLAHSLIFPSSSSTFFFCYVFPSHPLALVFVYFIFSRSPRKYSIWMYVHIIKKENTWRAKEVENKWGEKKNIRCRLLLLSSSFCFIKAWERWWVKLEKCSPFRSFFSCWKNKTPREPQWMRKMLL